MDKEIAQAIATIVQWQITFYWWIAVAILTWIFVLIHILFKFLGDKNIEELKSKLTLITQKDFEKNKKDLEYKEKLKQKKIDNYNEFIWSTISYLTILDSEISEKNSQLLKLKKSYWNLILTAPSKIVHLSTKFLLQLNTKEFNQDLNFKTLIIEIYKDIQGNDDTNKSLTDANSKHFDDILKVFNSIQKLEDRRKYSLLEKRIIKILDWLKDQGEIIFESPEIVLEDKWEKWEIKKIKYTPDIIFKTKNNKKIWIEVKWSSYIDNFSQTLNMLNQEEILKRHKLNKFILLSDTDNAFSISEKLKI